MRQALLGAPLLAELADDVLDDLAAASTIETFQAGEVIIAPGKLDGLHILDHGQAHLMLQYPDGDDLLVLEHQAGEVLGLRGDAVDSGHRAAVVATSDCRVIRDPVASRRRGGDRVLGVGRGAGAVECFEAATV